MAQHDIQDVGVYARFLKEHPAEVQLLFRELLINVTGFFRDREAFEALRKALPALFADKPEGWAFRAWIAGCATGEEAYSIAILVRELMEEAHLDFKVQISTRPISTTRPSPSPAPGPIHRTSSRTSRRSGCAGTS